MDLNRKKILSKFTPTRIMIPVIIGLSVTAFMFFRAYDLQDLAPLAQAKVGWLVAAVLVLLARDAGYVYRIRNITDKFLTWRNSLDVIVLWEFASALTPSVVGGTAVATFIMNKEGIPLGKSLAYVMITAVLDNMFFVLAAPIVLLATYGQVFPPVEGLVWAFGISYSLIALYTFLMIYALFINPRAFKWLLLKITSIRILRKWKADAFNHGNEIIWASQQLKGHGFAYWARAILSTIFIWSARYFLLNCLIAAFVDIEFADHMLIFSRNLIYWIVLLIAITPGGAGIAEIAFPSFFGYILGRLSAVVVLFFRMLTYYPYLILGSIFLPRWIIKVFGPKAENNAEVELEGVETGENLR
jgi:glycosyltransferase 2 family protein